MACFFEELIKNQPFFDEHEIALEVLYVDDGSMDKTADEVRKLRERDERVHLLSFSRNFGKEAAMYAGLEHAKGDYVVIMDADLQDPLPCFRRCFRESGRGTIPLPPGG